MARRCPARTWPIARNQSSSTPVGSYRVATKTACLVEPAWTLISFLARRWIASLMVAARLAVVSPFGVWWAEIPQSTGPMAYVWNPCTSAELPMQDPDGSRHPCRWTAQEPLVGRCGTTGPEGASCLPSRPLLKANQAVVACRRLPTGVETLSARRECPKAALGIVRAAHFRSLDVSAAATGASPPILLQGGQLGADYPARVAIANCCAHSILTAGPERPEAQENRTCRSTGRSRPVKMVSIEIVGATNVGAWP